jgi:hypothetical protein
MPRERISNELSEVNLSDEGSFVASHNSLPGVGKSSDINRQPSGSEISPDTNRQPSRSENSPNTNRQPSRSENLPNPIPKFSKIYNLALLEIGSDLYILDRVGVHYARTDLAENVKHPVYKVYSSGKTIKENIADFIEQGGIPSDDELRSLFQENEQLEREIQENEERLESEIQENEEQQERNFQENQRRNNSSFQIGTYVAVYIKDKEQWYRGTISNVNENGTYAIRYDDNTYERDVTKDRMRVLSPKNNSSNRGSSNNISNNSNSKINPTLVNSETSSFQRGTRVEGNFRGQGRWYLGEITNVNKNNTYNIEYNDGDNETNVSEENIRLPIDSMGGGMSHLETKSYYNGGGINYTYKTRSYPKNVSFSKKNPHKKTNKKTLRKLQRIIYNA